MDWVQVLAIIGSVVASAYYIHREVQQDVKASNLRTDRLYEMFIDLLKDARK